MLIRRRLGTLQSLVKEYGLTIDVILMKSCQNHADSLTRVPWRWMDLIKEGREPVLESCTTVGWLDENQVADMHHQSGHPGMKRTLYFGRSVDSQVSKETAKFVVKTYETCCSIDPAPVCWKKGKLSMKNNWGRLTMDITHHNCANFLSSTVAPLDFLDRCSHRYPTVGGYFPWARPANGNANQQLHCYYQ